MRRLAPASSVRLTSTSGSQEATRHSRIPLRPRCRSTLLVAMNGRAFPVTAIPLASLAVLAACAGSTEKSGVTGVERPAASSASPAPNTPAQPDRGKLAPAPTSRTLGQFWPTRICTRGPGAIVAESSCVCDSKMTCSVTRRGNLLDLHVGMTQEICKDCGTFSATCPVPVDARPRGSARTYRIAIDGRPVLDALALPPGDAVPAQHCYE
jgi:hypothetical protein